MDAPPTRTPDPPIVTTVAQTVAQPRRDPANSFVLHAPLELLARVGLVRLAPPEYRAAVTERFRAMVDEWNAFSEPVDAPAEDAIPSSAGASAALLSDALDAGSVETADAAAIGCTRTFRPDEFGALLGSSVLTRTSAAAHAGIFFHLLPRVAPRGEVSSAVFRPLARELARQPDWRIRWCDELAPSDASAEDLFAAIAATPTVEAHPAGFVHPTMMRVEETGIADDLLRHCIPSNHHVAVARVLQRAAALTMLQEPDEHAPYGWSHALTMTQGVLSLVDAGPDPTHVIAIAATYLVGFRASFARRALRAGDRPERSDLHWSDALDAGSAAAAGSVFHAERSEHEAIVRTLAGRGASHPDAHLAKYTLACFDAAAFDPEATAIYLAAAAHLHGVWASGPGGFDG